MYCKKQYSIPLLFEPTFYGGAHCHDYATISCEVFLCCIPSNLFSQKIPNQFSLILILSNTQKRGEVRVEEKGQSLHIRSLTARCLCVLTCVGIKIVQSLNVFILGKFEHYIFILFTSFMAYIFLKISDQPSPIY